jgi:hypothetical protein
MVTGGLVTDLSVGYKAKFENEYDEVAVVAIDFGVRGLVHTLLRQLVAALHIRCA